MTTTCDESASVDECMLTLTRRISVLDQRLTVHFAIFSLMSVVLEDKAPHLYAEFRAILTRHRDAEVERAGKHEGEARLRDLVRINEFDQMLKIFQGRALRKSHVVTDDDAI